MAFVLRTNLCLNKDPVDSAVSKALFTESTFVGCSIGHGCRSSVMHLVRYETESSDMMDAACVLEVFVRVISESGISAGWYIWRRT